MGRSKELFTPAHVRGCRQAHAPAGDTPHAARLQGRMRPCTGACSARTPPLHTSNVRLESVWVAGDEA